MQISGLRNLTMFKQSLTATYLPVACKYVYPTTSRHSATHVEFIVTERPTLKSADKGTTKRLAKNNLLFTFASSNND